MRIILAGGWAASANSGGLTTGRAHLDRRARDGPVRAKDAAIASLGLEPGSASLAVIEELASVGRHGLRGLMPAGGTGDGRLQLHGARYGQIGKLGQSNSTVRESTWGSPGRIGDRFRCCPNLDGDFGKLGQSKFRSGSPQFPGLHNPSRRSKNRWAGAGISSRTIIATGKGLPRGGPFRFRQCAASTR